MSEEYVPGKDLDVLVAEKVLGWRRVPGPSYDYDGPCESGNVLLPPTIFEDETWKFYPSRGKIPLGFFVTSRYSERMENAWRVLKVLRRRGWLVVVKEMPAGHPFVRGNDRAVDPKVHASALCELSWMPLDTEKDARKRVRLNPVGIANTTPLAICVAALQAAEQEGE